MFPTKTLARIYGLPSQKIDYDEIFKGEANAPAEAGSDSNWLPGLRPVEDDVETYFKDVFAGQVL